MVNNYIYTLLAALDMQLYFVNPFISTLFFRASHGLLRNLVLLISAQLST